MCSRTQRKRRTPENSVNRKFNFRERFLSNKRSVRMFSGHFRKGNHVLPTSKTGLAIEALHMPVALPAGIRQRLLGPRVANGARTHANGSSAELRPQSSSVPREPQGVPQMRPYARVRKLASEEREELERMERSRKPAAGRARRAEIVLLSDRGY